ncbi:MAG TPA: ABC transporter ATP-binding protein [Opitutaceae bacterium]|jgi:iron(III) transport system ATP-binding protein
MIAIRIQQLSKRFGSVTALRSVDLAIEPGELFFLLGPSGCGKTTLLRTIAGFHEPDSGRILFGEEDVTRVPPHRRNTGMMFQSYALWPHMTVAQNVAFGLEERKVPRPEIVRRVGEALEAMQLGALGERRPAQLSGGQQQRVALARALVIRPNCLLLDEPLSNLDAKLRLEMRAEIKRVCRDFRLTTIYVTHDQKEALSIADRMAILDGGSVLQVGTPRAIYVRPSRRSVAQFIGETDFLAGTLVSAGADQAIVDTPLGRFQGVLGDADARPAAGSAVTVSIRPECWRLSDEPAALNSVRGKVGGQVYLGELAQYTFTAGGTALKIFELNPRASDGVGTGERFATVEPRDVVVLAE